MIRGHRCAAARLGITGDTWSYPQVESLGLTGDLQTSTAAKSLGIIHAMSGDHLAHVWGSPMIPHHYIPTTTTNYPRGWLVNGTHDRPREAVENDLSSMVVLA